MAKHCIYPTPNPDGSDADRRIELLWQRDMYVQVGTTAWAGDTGSTPDRAAEYLPGTSANNLLRAWAGQFVDLTREQINHLIKQLRIARDQAFGRDE
jgi:hypothetical protein